MLDLRSHTVFQFSRGVLIALARIEAYSGVGSIGGSIGGSGSDAGKCSHLKKRAI